MFSPSRLERKATLSPPRSELITFILTPEEASLPTGVKFPEGQRVQLGPVCC